MSTVNKKRNYSNYSNWRVTQRYIRIEHNKFIVKWFRDTGSRTRQNLRNSLLIYKKDTANQILVKIQFFNQYIDRQEAVTLPLQYNTRVLPNISQLAVIFRPTSKESKSGNYTLHIPHYSGSKTPNISVHTKGNHWAKHTCKDGASILVYCKTEAEAVKIANQMNRYVDSKYKSSSSKPATGYMAHEPNKVVKVKPIRADYYKEGKKNQIIPDWRYYFTN